jgi:hypothetical protein
MKLCQTEWVQMSENNQDQELVEKTDDYVSTDIITDLKSGIYNLYLSLLNNLTAIHGPVEAVIISTQFLDNISNTFKETIQKDGE